MTDQPEPPAWTPPPPGDRREQLPDHILALLDIPPYTSTACEAADLLAWQMPKRKQQRAELGDHADRLHARCRLQNKFTGAACDCPCHQLTESVIVCTTACDEQHTYDWTCEQFAGVDDSDPADLTGYLAPDPPIGCLTVTSERTPSQRPGLHAQLADAIRTAACPGDCGKAEEECAREHIQPIVLHHDRIAEVSGSPDMFADVVLALLYREWPWLRAGAEDAVPPPGS